MRIPRCKHCKTRMLNGDPPCKDHRIGETYVQKDSSRNVGVVSANRYNRAKNNKGKIHKLRYRFNDNIKTTCGFTKVRYTTHDNDSVNCKRCIRLMYRYG